MFGSSKEPIELVTQKPPMQLLNTQNITQNTIKSTARMKRSINHASPVLWLRAGSNKFSAGSKAKDISRGQNALGFGAQAFPTPGLTLRGKSPMKGGYFSPQSQTGASLQKPQKIASTKHLSAQKKENEDPNKSSNCQEAYNDYKVSNEMSSTLSKVSANVRKDKQTSKCLDKLGEQLKMVTFMRDAELKNCRVQKLFIICELEIQLVYFLNIQTKKKAQ